MNNTLDQTHSQLLAQWDYEKNTVKPSEVTANSHKKVWWKCDKADDHRWEGIIQNRTKNNTSCPCCCNRKVVTSNCLATTHPELCEQWSPDNSIKPNEVTAGSNQKVTWQCSIAIDHTWITRVVDRAVKEQGCPYCYNKASSTNNLAETHPEECKEWHQSKNTLTPREISVGSMQKVWWKCGKGHEWQASPNNKIGKKQRCPYCSGKKTDGSNSLLALHPELCKEWDDVKNKVDPNTVLPNSHKKYWWRCSVNKEHYWESTPNNRVANNSACPECNFWKGESKVKEELDCAGVFYIRQYRTIYCVHKRSLPFDFALTKNGRVIGLIEFQGGQHYFPVKLFGGQSSFEQLQIRDRIKRQYCEDNKIPLLEIGYKQIKDIPKLIHDFVESLKKA